jgi:MoaA/NifB/PqqE/SkfB family radical SAM enzyme
MNAVNKPRIDVGARVELGSVVPVPVPFTLLIDVCNICNLKCDFCFQADAETMKTINYKKGLMKFDLFKKIVNDMAGFAYKPKKVRLGVFGEATMHPEFSEMIHYLKSKNVTEMIELFTNGTLLNPELNISLVDAGLDRMIISVEALTNKAYKKIAGVDVDIAGLIKNIEHLYHNKKNLKIYIKIVDSGLSEKEKKDFFTTFGNICDEIFIENIIPNWPGQENIIGSKKGMYGQETSGVRVCPSIFSHVLINHTGLVTCDVNWKCTELIFGSAATESIVDIWNGNKLKELRLIHLKGKKNTIDICSKCCYYIYCFTKKDNLDNYCDEILERI